MNKIYNNIINRLKEFQERNHVNGYVLGISGGKDSTVVAKLLVDAIGKENVLGVLMPNGEQKDIDDSYKVCKYLNINYTVININDAFDGIVQQVNLSKIHTVNNNEENIFLTEKSLTNVAPRIRMTTLYAIAQSLGYLVAGTGNKSERFVGWFTKWGDGACDINPIAHLTCTEVIELGDYLGLPYDLVHKTPADGLTGKSDEDNLGFTYKELDSLIKKFESPDYYIPVNQKERNMLSMHYNCFHKFNVITLE
jgi:NAD+ synthase